MCYSYVSCIAGCPYEGKMAPEKVAELARTFYEMGSYEISLGDTIGIGFPDQIAEVIRCVTDPKLGGVPLSAVALHCHDTHSRALVNIRRALEVPTLYSLLSTIQTALALHYLISLLAHTSVFTK